MGLSGSGAPLPLSLYAAQLLLMLNGL